MTLKQLAAELKEKIENCPGIDDFDVGECDISVEKIPDEHFDTYKAFVKIRLDSRIKNVQVEYIVR